MSRLDRRACLAALMAVFAGSAAADAVDALREFSRDVRTGRAAFTQVVTSPDGAKRRTSSGTFEFARPDRFRFSYDKPYAQLIVGDGDKVWLHDIDLQQVTVRAMDQALGATPAALLAGASLEKDFVLKAAGTAQGLDWVQAEPRQRSDTIGFQSLKVGFRGRQLAALELVDSFGQRSAITFSDLVVNAPPSPQAFRFTPPPGAEVIRP